MKASMNETDEDSGQRAADSPQGDAERLAPILRIPVRVDIVVGSLTMPVANLMRLARGAVLPLDRRIGDPVDVVVNGRIVARGEIVTREGEAAGGPSGLGVCLTEIVTADGG